MNWWDHESSPARLRGITSSIIEVFCDTLAEASPAANCPVEVAAARFEARKRHPGHHDAHRSEEEIEDGVRRMRETFRGPLRVGALVRVDTNGPIDADSVTGLVRSALDAAIPPSE